MIDAAANGIYVDPALAQFYDLGGNSRPDFEFCRSLAAGAETVLDLGCGTGALAVSLTDIRHVTAVDPAAAMLDIARNREGGTHVEFIQGDARSIRLNRQYDLVLLTGHTFQVFLTDADQMAALSTIAAHLSPTGTFIFDSRNPEFSGDKERDPQKNRRQLHHPEKGAIEAWNGSTYDETQKILSYENGYRVAATGETVSASAQIRYTSQSDLATMLSVAGLSAARWMGDWQGTTFEADSREIIPVGSPE